MPLTTQDVAIATVEDSYIYLNAPFTLREIIRNIGGGRWSPERRLWFFAATGMMAERIAQALNSKLEYGPPFQRLLEQAQIIKSSQRFKNAENLPDPPLVRTKPWDHQKRAYWFAKDLRAVYLAIEMRGGKTKVAIDLAANRGHKRILILAPLSVVDVWPAEFVRHSPIPIKVVPLGDKYKGVLAKAKMAAEQLALAKVEKVPIAIVINHESFWREPFATLTLKAGFDLVIIDECHPAGTSIATPHGPRAIETLQVGDLVWSFDHFGNSPVASRVTHCFSRLTKEPLARVGDTLMTPDHPVWTVERGYIPAKDVGSLDTVCYIGRNALYKDFPEDMRGVRHLLYGRETGEALLRPVVFYEKLRFYAGSTREIAATDEQAQATRGRTSKATKASGLKLQSIPRSANESEGVDCFARKGLCSLESAEGGQWQVVTCTASPSSGAPRLADRGCRASREEARLSTSLQARYSLAYPQNRYRGGWPESSCVSGQSKGYEKDNVSSVPRLDNASFSQRGDSQQLGAGSHQGFASCAVYNLETEKGNYFAEGLLVHNCHRQIKDAGGRASTFAAQLGLRIPWRMALSGTPMNSPDDIYAQYRFLDPGIFGTSQARFRQDFCTMGGWEGRQVVAFKNKPAFAEKVGSIMFRVKLKDVMKDLPAELDTQRMCTLGPAARKAYNEMEKNFITEVQEGKITTAANALTKLLRLEQITSGYLRTDQGEDVRIDDSKANLLGDLLGDIAPAEPVVVFCRFRHDLDRVQEIGKKMGRLVSELSGREKQLEEWRAGKTTILAVQIQAGGLGVDMTRASYVVYMSLGHSLLDYLQSRARVLGSGQTKRAVEFVHLLARESVDLKVVRALALRQDVVESVLKAAQSGRLF